MRIRILLTLLLLCVLATTASGDCFGTAGQMYGINPRLLKAIAKIASNFDPTAVHWNTNGSYDYGMMQINSCWRSTLGDRWQYLSDPDYNVMVGAWVLRQCMQKYGYSWDAVACYNTGKGLSDGRDCRRLQAIIYINKVWTAIQAISPQQEGVH